MGLSLSRVHEYAKVPGTTEVRLVGERPYLRLRAGGGDVAIFIQGGKTYTEGGQEITDLPYWFWDEADKVVESVARQVGLDKVVRVVTASSKVGKSVVKAIAEPTKEDDVPKADPGMADVPSELTSLKDIETDRAAPPELAPVGIPVSDLKLDDEAKGSPDKDGDSNLMGG